LTNYEESRVYKYDYERVFYTTIRVLQKSGCYIRAADFKAGVIFATYGDFFHAEWEHIPRVGYWGRNSNILEYVWIVFTASENYTELKLRSGYGHKTGKDFLFSQKHWEDILYGLDTELKTNKSSYFPPQKIPRKPRSLRSIFAVFVNIFLIYLFVYIFSNYEGDSIWLTLSGYESILVIGGLSLTSGSILNSFRQYKIGIPINIIGIFLVIFSLNLMAIILFVLFNIIVLRDAWFYSKWDKIVSEQKRNRSHNPTSPKSICPYCYETLNKPVNSCPYCEEHFTV
jgi:hypothetical protein